MSQIELIIFTSIVLFITFSLGWLARILIEKLSHKSSRTPTGDRLMAESFHKSEIDHALIFNQLKKRDTELTSKLAQAQAELKATMDGLHDARIEIETLKEISEKTKKDKKIIEAMIKGDKLIAFGQSRRGTKTKDTYSLNGFAKAFNKIKIGRAHV